MCYHWPGNIRELSNLVQRLLIIGAGTEISLDEVERRHILGVLQKSGWRLSGKGGAAELLGLKRTTLQSKMKKLGIKRPPE